MAPPRRTVQATALETTSPPATLSSAQSIARVIKAEGNNLYTVELPSHKTVLVELPSRFRSTIWIKRGGFVVVDTEAFDDRDNKLAGEILNVVRDEKEWRKQPYWPAEFPKKNSVQDSDDEESNVGKMPPAEDTDEES
ncbi:MAG: hypothetical protein M1825_002495 [Sarcosagium campestre]|nr:MAG: hypothetical protein M1825_002495 [Sarcosagium campestre]